MGTLGAFGVGFGVVLGGAWGWANGAWGWAKEVRFGGWGSQKETETEGFDGLGYLKVGDFGGFWSWGLGFAKKGKSGF